MPPNALNGFPSVPCWQGFLTRKIQGFRSSAIIKQQRRLCQILGEADFVAAGGCGCGVTMMTLAVVGNGGVGQVEGFWGSGKGERNERQRGDNKWYIVLVLVTKNAYITCPPFLIPLSWLIHLLIKESGQSAMPRL